MTLPNPTAKFAKSNGIDMPIMTVYLAGRIAGNCIDKCLAWRKQIVEHYKKFKPIYDIPKYKNGGISKSVIVGYESYPISFLDALNSKEADSVDKLGLTSCIPPNLIWAKDILSIHEAKVIVANMDDFFEDDIKLFLHKEGLQNLDKPDLIKMIEMFQDKILNRRENLGTISEVAISLYLGKPTILIVPERRKEIFEKHPFMRRASVIITSVDELLEKKWLQVLYKSIAGCE